MIPEQNSWNGCAHGIRKSQAKGQPFQTWNDFWNDTQEVPMKTAVPRGTVAQKDPALGVSFGEQIPSFRSTFFPIGDEWNGSGVWRLGPRDQSSKAAAAEDRIPTRMLLGRGT